ncbi:MAG: bifunctional lysylphosphatidylglycerol flippase/synthetase MprF [Nevskiaceae bacterium]|nr:MAG: bifunctional lysylphosphatidylglycerol flippase/synthetase MprF [Nevskiaceae bacterium]TBR73936.1 MAG: bifunctional lysylphosphatidylglycerol flippase/synthetase MprF [Nevskiaceae bacterium]
MPKAETVKSSTLRNWLMPAITLTVFTLAMVVLYHHLSHLQWSHVIQQFVATSPLAIVLALAGVVCSYILLTGYDVLALRVLRHPLPYSRVAETAFTAYAVGQNVGLSSISGGSIRLRRYTAEGLTPLEVGGVVALSALTFTLGVTALLALSLLFEAEAAQTALHVTPQHARLAGGVLLAAIAGYLAFTASGHARLDVRGHVLSLPGLRQSIAQMAIGGADLCCAAAALYFLLPAGLEVSYPGFVGVFVLAIAAGVASGVPGGLGVFESILLLLLPHTSGAALLGAALLYRALYYLLPLACGVALLAAREWNEQRSHVLRPIQAANDWIGVFIPQAMAGLVFIAGAVLLVSGSVPVPHHRMAWLRDFVPLGVVEISHLMASVVGVGLLILARGLSRRLDGAWWLTEMLIVAGIVVQLLKGVDYVGAIVLVLVGGLLWLARTRFYRRAPLLAQRFSPLWVTNVALVLVAVIWIGLQAYRHVDYANELWWQFAFHAGAPRMLRASLVAVMLVAAYAFWQLLGVSRPRVDLPTATQLDQARRCMADAEEPVANLALLGDKQFLFSAESDAFIMYQRSGRSWVALGDPVGNPARFEALAWRFRELCDRNNGWPVFYEVSAAQLPLYLDLGLSLIKLGEEARVPLEGFSLDGPKRAELRTARRKGEREGLSFRVLEPDEVVARMDELRLISEDWLLSRTVSEKGFSVGNFDPDYLRNFRVAAAFKGEAIVAFANLWHSREEVSIDLMRHGGAAPRGVMDYLFIETALWACTRDYHWFNLGMAPLAGLEKHPLAPLWHKLGLLVQHYGEPFYNFDGLRRYKEKFGPEWRPRYLASPGGLRQARILLDTAALIAGGMKEVLFK